MNKINTAFKIASQIKPKCFAKLYFPFTEVEICNCVDYCKYTPPAISNPDPSKYIYKDTDENIHINLEKYDDDIYEKIA